MPIYEYRCAGCGADFELTRSMSQSGDPAPCPSCGKPAEKLVSSFASKADYAIKVPAKEPFRAPAGSGAAGAPSGSPTPSARGPARSLAKPAVKPAASAAKKVVAKAAGAPAGRRTSKAK